MSLSLSFRQSKFAMFIFFDLDGTLVDHRKAAEQANHALWERHRHTLLLPREEFITRFEETVARIMTKSPSCSFLKEGANIVRTFFAGAGHDLSNTSAQAEFDRHMQIYLSGFDLFADAVACLDVLRERDIPLGIISNGDRAIQLEKLERFALKKYFKIIVLSAEVGVAKPHPDIFNHACRLTSRANADCFFVGDDLDVDIVGADRAGMKAIWIDRADKKRDATEAGANQENHVGQRFLEKAPGAKRLELLDRLPLIVEAW
jgi:putative hydrolase of the HAD superfamily